MKIASVKVVHDRDNSEWIVKAYDANGNRMPKADYFTTDKADAQGTAKLMVQPNKAK